MNKQPVEYRIFVLNFGRKCSPSVVNFALRQTAINFGDWFDDSVSDHVNRRFYVDDFLVSSESISETQRALNRTRDMIANGNLNLKICIANHIYILRDIPSCDKKSDNSKPYEILGLDWHIPEGTLACQRKEKQEFRLDVESYDT